MLNNFLWKYGILTQLRKMLKTEILSLWFQSSIFITLNVLLLVGDTSCVEIYQIWEETHKPYS